MLRSVTFLLLFSCYFLSASAQGENNIWCFGHRTGLDFTGGNPVFFEHEMEVLEGCASVCDAAGALLFYTSGSKVWDRNHNLMPNGNSLSGNIFSSMDGVTILPAVNAPGRYYVFTTDQAQPSGISAYYSAVDMSMNGGLGDVIPTQSSVLIDTGFEEGVVTSVMPGCNGYWIILHRLRSSDYLAYSLTAAGFNPVPVVSTGFTSSDDYYNGYNRFNNAGNRVVRSANTQMETAAFNQTTGQFSDFRIIDLFVLFTQFSPDDQTLYIGSLLGAGAMAQIDITLLPDTAAVRNSYVEVIPSLVLGMRLGPDNKLYALTTGHIARVNNPNAAGMACDPDPTFLSAPPYANPVPGSFMCTELGSPVIQSIPDTATSGRDTVVCFREQAVLQAPEGYQSYKWNTGGTGPSETVTHDGSYWVGGRKGCTYHVDTFHVTFNNFTVDLGPDTFVCEGRTLTLDVTRPGATYSWQDGNNAAVYTVSQPGTYAVSVTRNTCTASDTILVDLMSPALNIPEPDTVVCPGTRLQLHAVAKPESQLLWNNGNTSDQIIVDSPGTYTVTATNVCGTFTDEVVIGQIVCNCNTPFVPNAFSPNGDGKNETVKAMLLCPGMTGYSFMLYNRYGQSVFETNDPDMGWDGLHHGQKADMGVYFYYLKYKTPQGHEVKKKGDIMLLR